MRLYVSPAPFEGAGLGMRRAAGAMLLALGLGVAAALLGAWSLALLAPIFVAVCVVWPAVGVVTLIVACALDRVAIGVGGSNVRPDEVAALALTSALLVRLAWTRTPHQSGGGRRKAGGDPPRPAFALRPPSSAGRGGPG